jgi:hypothetical protein
LAIAGDRLSGGRSEVRAEASGAVSQGCRKISRTRGLHKEVGPASLEPKWCLRRGRLVSRSGKNNGISAMWKPTTLLRAVWSYPTHRERTARTSSPRWARTVRASERS